MNSYTLSNNVSIPELGFGTWQTPNGDVAVSAVKKHWKLVTVISIPRKVTKMKTVLDKQLKESGIPREEIFLTTKLWNENHSYDLVLSSFEESLKKLQTDYIDLFLIHWPNPVKFRDNWQSANAETWRAMEELYQAGKDQSHRRQQFLASSFRRTEKTATIFPMVNQIFLAPGELQKK